MRSVQEIADELYVLPPASFTAARDDAAAQARAEGARDLAKQIAELKRPTQGAHLVNLLALRRPDVVSGLLTLGEQIRAAQGTVPAAQVRELSTQRRTAISDALAICRELAAQAGSGEPTGAQLSEAETTLAAAMADDSAAEVVRAGRAVKALSYAGFGAGFGAAGPIRSATPARPGARPPSGAAPAEGPPVDAAAQRRADERRREAERLARERLARAEAGFATTQATEQAANDEMDRIVEEITRLRAALEEATKQAKIARTGRQAAERELASARREVNRPAGDATG
jgi:hypothetical protein